MAGPALPHSGKSVQPSLVKPEQAITFGSCFGLKCFISLSQRRLRSQPDHLWQYALKFSPAQPAGVLDPGLVVDDGRRVIGVMFENAMILLAFEFKSKNQDAFGLASTK